jgi:IclR family transcriptional regulator, KDG regulon repressor
LRGKKLAKPTGSKADDGRELPAERYEVEAVARAAHVLAALQSQRQPLTLPELSRITTVPEATLLGILNTLAAHDLLTVDPDQRYGLGYEWLRYGELRRKQINLRESALPLMRQVRDQLNETVILSLRVGDRRVHLDYVESTQPIRRVTQLGHEGPLHVGAAGLVLLAHLGDGEIDAYLRRELGVSDSLAAQTDEIRKSVAAIRRQGYAVVSGKVNIETAAVAAPVRDHTGEPIAALTISCPRDRFTKALRDACIAHVGDGAARLSRRLGYEG